MGDPAVPRRTATRARLLVAAALMAQGCTAPTGSTVESELPGAAAVLESLGQAERAAYRGAVARGALDGQLRRQLERLFGVAGAAARIEGIEQNGGIELLRREPEGALYVAIDVREAAAGCMVVDGRMDLSRFLDRDDEPEYAQFLLRRADHPGEPNPAPWRLEQLVRQDQQMPGSDPLPLSCTK